MDNDKELLQDSVAGVIYSSPWPLQSWIRTGWIKIDDLSIIHPKVMTALSRHLRRLRIGIICPEKNWGMGYSTFIYIQAAQCPRQNIYTSHYYLCRKWRTEPHKPWLLTASLHVCPSIIRKSGTVPARIVRLSGVALRKWCRLIYTSQTSLMTPGNRDPNTDTDAPRKEPWIITARVLKVYSFDIHCCFSFIYSRAESRILPFGKIYI